MAAVANADGSFEGIAFLNPIGTPLRDGNVAALAGLNTNKTLQVLDTAELNFDTDAKIQGAVMADLADLLSVCQKRPTLLGAIKLKVSRMYLAETDLDRKRVINDFWKAIREEDELRIHRAGVQDKPKDQQEFLERNNPRLGLFNSIGKSIQKHGLTNLITIEQTYFDPETGRSMQKIEHSITFAHVLELYRTWEVFVQIMSRLGFGSYGGWDLISREIYTVLAVHGVGTGHKFITECLNALDTKTVGNPTMLLSTGKAYMYLNTLLVSKDSSSRDPAAGKSKGAAVSDQCKRGPVTQIGEFASIIKKHGACAPCYNYNNGTNCLYGVDDRRFPEHKGKCAFAHICEKCGKNHPKGQCP